MSEGFLLNASRELAMGTGGSILISWSALNRLYLLSSPVHGDLWSGSALQGGVMHRPQGTPCWRLQPHHQTPHQGGVPGDSALLQVHWSAAFFCHVLNLNFILICKIKTNFLLWCSNFAFFGLIVVDTLPVEAKPVWHKQAIELEEEITVTEEPT